MIQQCTRLFPAISILLTSLSIVSPAQAKSSFASESSKNTSATTRFSTQYKSVLLLADASPSAKAEPSWQQLELQRKSQQLITLSGFSSLINQVPMHFNRGVTNALVNSQIDVKHQHDLLHKAHEAYTAADVQFQLANSVAAELSEREVDTLLSWYHSPAGQKISAAQAYASSEKGFADMMRQANTLLNEQRLMSLAVILDKQLNFTDFIVELQKYQAFAEYSTQRSYRIQPLQRQQFDQAMHKRKEELHFNAEQLVTISLAYAFKDISAEEVAAYKEFLQKPLSQSYLKAAMAGLKTGMERVVDNWITAVDFVAVQN